MARSFLTGEQVIEQAYRPNGIALADFDEDGDLDVAAAHVGNWITPNVSIQFNNGDGTLAPAIALPVPGETWDVVAADLDGDQHVDLAFTEYYSYDGAMLYVMRGNGDGTFGPVTTTPAGRDPERLASADFDNDGDIDLACVNNWITESVTVFYNNGDATFTTINTPVPGGDGPMDIDAGDLDGDGWTDLAVSIVSSFQSVVLMYNDGAGGFDPPIYRSGPFGRPGVAIADLNGDAKRDLIVSSGWMRNQGGRTFDNLVDLPADALFTTFGDIAVADVNLDGDLDVLAVPFASDHLGWQLIASAGDNLFHPGRHFRFGQYARAIEAADMDNDGDLDVVVANGHSLTVKIHTNDAGTFHMPYRTEPVDSFVLGMDAADIDLDGDLDVVSGAYQIQQHLNNGDGTFVTSEVEGAVLGRKYRYKLADINGDNYPDLLYIRHRDSPPYWLFVALNTGEGSFGPTTEWFLQDSCGSGDLDTLDWDNDGDLDVVVTDNLGCPNVEGVRFHLVEGNGDGTFQPDVPRVDFTMADPQRVKTGDFDQDGNQDILATVSERLGFWKGNGDGTFDTPIQSDIDPAETNERNPWHMTVADFNGDGIQDVATANIGWTLRGENITVLLGNGDGTFTAVGLYYTMHALSLAGTGGIGALDADQDGDMDIVAGAIYGCDIVLLLNHGDGTFAEPEGYGLDGNPFDLRTGDFDGDGIDDVATLVAVHFGSSITVLPGLGVAELVGDFNQDGVVNAEDYAAIYECFAGPGNDVPPGCDAADLNDDGHVDLREYAAIQQLIGE